MTALFLHFLWMILYISSSIVLYFISLIFFKNNINNLLKYNNNIFLKFFLIVFFNKNLNLFKNKISKIEIEKIEKERIQYYPTLNLIHNNINKLVKKTPIEKKKFKILYKNFYYLDNNINLQNTHVSDNSKITFIILSQIVQQQFKTLNIKCFYDLLTILLILRNSISNNYIILHKFNLIKFNDYINYLKLTTSETLKNKVIIITPLENFKTNQYLHISKKTYYYSFINNLNNYVYLKYKQVNLINFNAEFLINVKNKFNISFSPSTIVKYFSDNSLNKAIILYLRKNKVFNKSRYSRNRQTYRTGAYWCLYVNIVAVIGFYFWFYKFTMNFGYMWWILYSFILIFFLPRALKYKFYKPTTVIIEIKNGLIWISSVLFVSIKDIKVTQYQLSSIVIKSYQLINITKFTKIKKFEYYYIYQSFNLINNVNKFLQKIINNFIY